MTSSLPLPNPLLTSRSLVTCKSVIFGNRVFEGNMIPQSQGKELPQSLQRLSDPNTHRDDVPLEAMGRVSTLYHGAQLRVAHSRLGSGGAHRTCKERVSDSWRVLHGLKTIENDSPSPSYGPAPVNG